MKKFSRNQKLILLILGILNVCVIVGLGSIVFSSMRRLSALQQPMPTSPMPTHTVVSTPDDVLRWTPTTEPTAPPTLLPRATNTPTPTPTPRPTHTPTPTATPTLRPTPIPVSLANPEFDNIMPNRIPGWDWYAYVNYKSGETDPQNSFAEPLFTAADDPVRRINGSTLKVETIRWLKFRTWVHQTVTVTAGSSVQFSIKANAYSSLDRLIVKAGIDPTGQPHCDNIRWGEARSINQDDGIVTLMSPRVVVTAPQDRSTPTPTATPDPREGDTSAPEEPEEEPVMLGQVTVCFYAEPAYPHINNAAFFDQANLTVTPPR